MNHFLWFDCPFFCPVGLGVVVIFLCIVIFGFASLIKDQCCCFSMVLVLVGLSFC